MTYEGSVNVDTIEDPMIRQATEEQVFEQSESTLFIYCDHDQQIASFGQTPPQLFEMPHPSRAPLRKLDRHLAKSFTFKTALSKVPLAFVSQPRPGELVVVDCNQILTTSLLDVRLGFGPRNAKDDATPRRLGEPMDQSVKIGGACFAALSPLRAVFMCGFWDNSFKLFGVDSGRLLKSVFGHGDVVSALCLSYDNLLLLSGSRDAIIYLWDVKVLPNQTVDLHKRTMLVGHEHPITCLAIDVGQDIVVSGSHALVLIHTLAGDLLHAINPQLQKPHLAAISANGSFVTFFRDKAAPTLTLFHINGRALASMSIAEHLTELVVTRDGEFLITAGFGQRVHVRRLWDLQLVFEYDLCGSSIRHLTLAHNETVVIAALTSGELVTFAVDTDVWRAAVPIQSSPMQLDRQASLVASP